MSCLDTNSMMAYLKGKKENIILIDHALLDQIGVFSPVTGREIHNASTISSSDVGVPLHLPAREKEIPLSWIVYILECADKTLYTGITNNLEHRLQAHANGKGAKYTRGRGPFSVLYTETHPTISQALHREVAIKKLDPGSKRNLASSTLTVKRRIDKSNESAKDGSGTE